MAYARRKDPRAVRRIVLGFGLGLFFAVAPCVTLLLFRDRSSSLPTAAVIALAVSLGVAAPLAIFSAFSWALFYRCPQCKQPLPRLEREPLADGTGISLRYTCDRCQIQWDIGWRERSGDGG